MKKYLVVLVPRNDIPEEGWNTALVRIRMYTYAENGNEARKNCERVCENHGLYMKAQYSRCVKEERL